MMNERTTVDNLKFDILDRIDLLGEIGVEYRKTGFFLSTKEVTNTLLAISEACLTEVKKIKREK